MKKIIFSFAFLLLLLTNSLSQNFSLDFDGTDDYVTMGDILDLGTSDFTIEAWIFIEGTTSLNKIINKGLTTAGTPTNAGFALRTGRIQPDNIEFAIGHSDGTFTRVESSGLITNQWQHIAGVREGTTIRLYIDGVNVATNTTPVIYNVNTNIPFAIGALHRGIFGNTTEVTDGKIDDVRIWNVARTQAEIQNSSNTELTGTEIGLVAYYKMDNPVHSGDIKDCTTNNYHGVRMGIGGSNNLPQLSNNIPGIINIASTTDICSLIDDLINDVLALNLSNTSEDVLKRILLMAKDRQVKGSNKGIINLIERFKSLVLIHVGLNNQEDLISQADIIIFTINENILFFKPNNQIGKDAVIIFTSLTHPNLNFGNDIGLLLTAWTAFSIGSADNDRRSFIEFTELDEIQSLDLVKATLKLYAYPNFPGGGGGQSGLNSASIFRVTEPWEENIITWNNQPAYDNSISSIIPQNNNYTFIEVDVTDLVNEIINNPNSSHGFLLRFLDESPYRSLTFASSDFSDYNLAPELMILAKNVVYN